MAVLGVPPLASLSPLAWSSPSTPSLPLPDPLDASRPQDAFAIDSTARVLAADRLLQDLQVGILTTDLAGSVLACNEAAWQTAGYASKADFLAVPFPIHYVDPTVRTRLMQRLQSEDIIRDFEAEFRTNAGSTFWSSVTLRALRDASGQLIGSEGTFVEATTRVHAQQAAAAANANFERLMQDLNVAYVSADLDSLVLDCNDAFWQILGYPNKQALLGTPFATRYADPTARPRMHALLKKQGFVKNFEAEIKKADDSTLWFSIELRLFKSPDGRPLRTEALAVDITPRIQAQLALASADSRLRDLMQDLRIGTLSASPVGQILACNDVTWQIAGYASKADFLTVPFATLYADPTARARLFQKLGAEDILHDYEVEFKTFAGSTFWASMTLRAIRDGSGQIVATDGLFTDVTSRVRAEQESSLDRTRLSTTLEHSPVLFATVDSDLRFTYASGSILETFKSQHPDLAGSSTRTYLEADPQWAPILQALARAVSGIESCFDAQILQSWYHLNFSPLLTQGIPGASVVGFDITALLLAEQESILNRARLDAALASAPLLLATVDKDLNFTFTGGAGVRGNTLDDHLLRGTSARLPMQSRPDLIQSLERAVAGIHSEVEAESNGGWSHIKFSPLAPSGASMVAFDITDRHQLDLMHQDLIRRLIEAQEKERSRIAIEIHDGAVQVMTAASMHLHLLTDSLSNPTQQAQLQKLLTTVTSSIARLRNLLFDLNPPALEMYGLSAALTTLCEEFQLTAAPSLILHCDLPTEPDPSTALAIYRIVQEALINIRKHAHASQVSITLAPALQGLSVIVQDDGVGLDPRILRLSVPGHLGLTSMRERIELLGGHFTLTSVPSVGTQVEFWVPLSPSTTLILLSAVPS